MITCKEDLINTYIENDHGELLDLYIEKAIELGFSHQYGFRGDVRDHYSLRFIGINEHNNSEKNPRIGQAKMEYTPISMGRKITLSDLKTTKQYAVLHKGGSYSFQSDKPVGDDVVACFDLVHSEEPIGEDFFCENRQDDKQIRTYNTYQEAKIANPECEIVTLIKPDSDLHGLFEPKSACHIMHPDGGWHTCNPANYCMTVEEFLKAGHKFEAGDLWIDYDGDFMTVGNLGVNHMNKPHERDLERYILRAAALEKPRTKVEFVKVAESIFDLRDEFERGDLYFNADTDGEYHQIQAVKVLGLHFDKGNLYRRIETEIDERQEFIDAACSVIEDYHGERRQYVVEALYDSGKFKLVN